jgi:hypothetical protein
MLAGLDIEDSDPYLGILKNPAEEIIGAVREILAILIHHLSPAAGRYPLK